MDITQPVKHSVALMTAMRAVRRKLGMSQEDVARELNITSRTYWTHEGLEREPRLEFVAKYLDFLKKHTDTIKKLPRTKSQHAETVLDSFRALASAS